MDIMLRAFNESVGYCGSSPWVADLERVLDEEGKLEDFVAKFEEISKRSWVQTRAKALLNRDAIIKALVAVRGMTEEVQRRLLRIRPETLPIPPRTLRKSSANTARQTKPVLFSSWTKSVSLSTYPAYVEPADLCRRSR